MYAKIIILLAVLAFVAAIASAQGDTCKMCTDLVDQAKDAIKNQSDVQKYKWQLNELCKKLYFQQLIDQCKSSVSQYFDQIIDMLKKDSAKQICTQIGMCQQMN